MGGHWLEIPAYTEKRLINPERYFTMIDLRLLISKGVHFGHQSSRGNPKMRPYVWGKKNGIDIIDVTKTAHQLEKAAQFIKKVASEGKEILWCGTKKAAAPAILGAGEETASPFAAHRWIGGTITNNVQVKKAVTKLLHLEDVLEKGGEQHTKKELGIFTKQVERARRNVGGLRNLAWPVGALVVVDVKKEHVAVREAIERGIPVVALVDTNSDPSDITYVVPANDDAPQSVACIIDYLIKAVQEGKAIAKERAAKESAERAEKAKAAQANAPQVSEEESVLKAQLAAVEAALGGEEGSEKTDTRKAGPSRGRRPVHGGDRRGGPSKAPRKGPKES